MAAKTLYERLIAALLDNTSDIVWITCGGDRYYLSSGALILQEQGVDIRNSWQHGSTSWTLRGNGEEFEVASKEIDALKGCYIHKARSLNSTVSRMRRATERLQAALHLS